ncbi:MAG TPA: GlsB/YeaQ/YmgE family stress response membrane protein [Thermoanaerobaculia bacterium]|nr:GlsB/YeaQ/YmgE family stress response membrane protein [Thermoanaerobaculia bacterium]
MSYVFIGLIGALTGWVVGQFVTGSRQAIAIDMMAGAVGAWVTVVLCRVVIPTAGGPLMSAIVAVIGAVVTLFVMNRFLRRKLMTASRVQRR